MQIGWLTEWSGTLLHRNTFFNYCRRKINRKESSLVLVRKDDELIARIAEHWGTSDRSCQFLVESYESLNLAPRALFLDGPSDMRSYKAEWLWKIW